MQHVLNIIPPGFGTEPFFSVGAKGEILACNKAAATIAAASMDELNGKKFSSLFSEPVVAEKMLREVFAKGYTHNFQLSFYSNKISTPVIANAFCITDQFGEINVFVIAGTDNSRQKQAFEENKLLKEQRLLFASIVNSSDDAILSKTLDGIITSWNAGAEKIFQYTAEEIIGRHIFLLIPVHLQEEEKSILEKISRGEMIKHYETERIRKDGTVISLMLTISPIKDISGNIIGASKIAKDITERKRAEEQLIQSNALLEKAEAQAGLGSWQIDVNTGKGKWSKQMFRFFGLEISDTAPPFEDYLLRVHPDDREYILQAMNDSLEGRIPVSKVYRTNPAMLPLLYLLPSWQTQNDLYEKTQFFEGTLLDVTELKNAEQKISASEKIYKTIASSIPDSVICILDKEYRYLLIEGDMLEKLGYSKANLLGCKAKDALSPQTFAEVENDFIKAFNGEIVSRENTRLGYDTITRFIPLKDERNEVNSIMTVSIDITRLKAAQRSINELNRTLEDKIMERTEELKRSNEELEAFSYSVSHDLRAPLRAVSGYAGMLEEDYNSIFDSEGKRQLAEIRNNAKRMGMLIDDLLNFSRLGRKEVEKSLVDMDSLTRFAIDEVSFTNNNHVKFNIEKLPPVMADYTLMQNVMINLISNAVKYSSKNNSPVVEISAQASNNQITYCVSDNGVGFDMEYVHKLFGVFQRLHGNDEFPGTGVGLAIVQRIIEKHKGRVWAEGKIGEGASFYFALPLS